MFNSLTIHHLGNLFLNDMGDNLNANGAAPVAPYVFLSFLFEIVVEFMFLVCVLDSICSSTMLVRMISLISVIAVMIYFVLIRIKSRSNLLIYSTGATSPTASPSYAAFCECNVPYSHSHFMDGLVDASKEPFVYCYECPVPFWGSPADIVHHLMDVCSGHY